MKTRIKNGRSESMVFSSIDRSTPPSTEKLQHRILAETSQMPQHTSLLAGVKKSTKRVQPRRFSWRWLPATGVAAVVFSVALGLNSLWPKQSEITEFAIHQPVYTTSDELAWQDVMLMHDELAFIDL